LTPLDTPRTGEDWRVMVIPTLGSVHYSCSQVFEQVKYEVERKLDQQHAKTARERIGG
jgi:hypothetical protein